MDLDLYKDDLGAVAASDLHAAIEQFTRISQPPHDRLEEGYLIDFKQQWGDDTIKSVAAFANTFGGILLVGVTEHGGRADQITGVPAPPRQELKNSYASSIASNITPTPPFEIWDAPLPSDQTKHLIIIRVRTGKALHLITKKGLQPVYIRNENESIPADAARLQSLISARVLNAGRPPEGDPLHKPPGGRLLINNAQANTDGYRQSPTFIHIALIPEEPLAIALDSAVERRITAAVRDVYPAPTGFFMQLEIDRGTDWYQVKAPGEAHAQQYQLDHEMRWGVAGSGAFHLIAQVRAENTDVTQSSAKQGEGWSLVDLMTDLACTIEAAHRFWKYIGYFGQGRLYALLDLNQLEVIKRAGFVDAKTRELGEAYPAIFYTGKRPALRLDLSRSVNMQRNARASVEITYATRTQRRAEAVATATNQLLRGIGYGASLEQLRDYATK